MKRRILILAGIFAASIGIVLAVIAMLLPNPGVTKANFDRIKKGMTKAEVVAILGREPDHVDPLQVGRKGGSDTVLAILGRGGYGFVGLGSDSVVWTEWYWDETWTEKLRRTIHLPW